MLPVEQIKADLLAPFAPDQPKRIILKSPTGSGKSTAVPPMLLHAGEAEKIVVVQPRRLAARLLAKRVAELLESPLGETVGYVVRFDHKQTAATRIVYITDGIFQNWLKDNPNLKGISTVIFDEFHERRVASDRGLAQCLNLQESKRSNLQVIVMSATLKMSDLGSYMNPCRELKAEGRSYPVEISYHGEKPATRGARNPYQKEAIWETCANHVCKAIEEDHGNVLIFLPGMYEIKKMVSLLKQKSWLRGWKICPLYSALAPRQQEEAIRPCGTPKIIVSTNVAETSLTIEGVRTVIDAGLARQAQFDPRRGIETLMISPISKAAADQRAGRAGRTAPGRCIRLWSHTQHQKKIDFDRPEIQRCDLAELYLQLAANGEKMQTFRWLDKPEETSVNQAKNLLIQLDALDEEDEITSLGKKMAAFALPPRYSRLIFGGIKNNCVSEAAFIAAAIQGEGIFLKKQGGLVGKSDFLYEGDFSDFAGEYRAFESAQAVNFDPKRCSQFSVLARGAKECKLAFEQIKQELKKIGVDCPKIDFDRKGKSLSRAVIQAFPDRIGVKLSPHTLATRLVDGRKGQLDPDSVAKKAELFIPTNLTEIEGRDVVVRMSRAVIIDHANLQKDFPADFNETENCIFNPMTKRVESQKETRFKGLLILSKPSGKPNPDQASSLLAEKVAAGELIMKEWDSSVETWIARLIGLAEWMPELELPSFTQEDRSIALEQLCQGATSYKEIKNKPVLPAIKQWLSPAQQETLDAFAPEKIKLSNGQNVKIYYAKDKKPWIAQTAQRLIGVKKTPTIANGKLKLNVHICAPNQRPWQITDDLENFWKTGFEQMRKDLAGRYPKHQWELPNG